MKHGRGEFSIPAPTDEVKKAASEDGQLTCVLLNLERELYAANEMAEIITGKVSPSVLPEDVKGREGNTLTEIATNSFWLAQRLNFMLGELQERI